MTPTDHHWSSYKPIQVCDCCHPPRGTSLVPIHLSSQRTLTWRHNEHDGVVSNHQPHDCLLNRLFRCRSKTTSKLCVIGLCEGNSLVTSEFPAQRASNAENVSILWRHHERKCGHNIWWLYLVSHIWKIYWQISFSIFWWFCYAVTTPHNICYTKGWNWWYFDAL